MEIEARARLASVLDVCEHEGEALQELKVERVTALLDVMRKLRGEIVTALGALTRNQARRAVSDL
jgi:hypothetical protein